MIDRNLVRFGTSSWAYQGWQGLVYRQAYQANRFSKESLSEYARYEYRGAPLFRTVGIDHTFYRPATARQLAHYAAQVPPDFRFCAKVWEELTILSYANLPRYGAKAGKMNPRFLDQEAFRDLVLGPFLEGLGNQAGPLIFEFQRSGMAPDEFYTALDRFLSRLPVGPAYAVEIRNPALLETRYRDLLRAHNVAHVLNHWTAMPPLREQFSRLGNCFPASLVVFRLLTPRGLPYEQAVKRYSPYNRIVEPQLEMRRETVSLLAQALSEGRTPYVLVNNRCEGNAPLTLRALVDECGTTSPA
jgi:uncharacterized protein YecE (DUF72 family)